MVHKTRTKALSWLLTLALILGLLPGLSIPARAGSPYTGAAAIQYSVSSYFSNNGSTATREYTLEATQLPCTYSITALDTGFNWSNFNITSVQVTEGTNITIDSSNKTVTINDIGESKIQIVADFKNGYGRFTFNNIFTVSKVHTHNIGEGESARTVTFAAWTNTESLPDTAGSYYLTSDVVLSNTWTVPTGEVNLCLNGCGVTYKGSGGSVIQIPENATLNLFDCGETTHSYTITDGLAKLSEASNTVFNGGYITGGSGNHGGVNNLGTFNMTGGNIIGNKAQYSGGGVYSYYNAAFTMTGGTIIGNSASSGGGVYSYGGAFTMSGGAVIGNNASNGGGVYNVDGTFTMSDGTVADNTATESGGGMYNTNDYYTGTITISGGTITDNTATDSGGGVYNSGTFNVSDAPTITNNKSGTSTALKDDNLYVTKDKTISITGALANTTPIGITMQSENGGVFTNSTVDGALIASGYRARFIGDSGYVIAADGNELKLVAHTHNLTYSAVGNIITATCTGEDCPLEVVAGTPTATLSLDAPAEGGDYDAVLIVSDAGIFPSNLTIQYLDDGGTDWTTTAPNKQGFHRAKTEWSPAGEKLTAQMTYGIACLTYAESLTNGSISGPANAVVGATITPTITPDEGYELDTLTVKKGDEAVAVTDNKSFVMPEANVTVSATFKLKPFAINSGLEAGATMTAKVEEEAVTTAKMGDSVTLTITPDAGYTVNTVSVKNSAGGDVDVTSGSDGYSFTMPASDVTVTATYNAIDYSVTVSAAEHGSVSAKIGENDASTANVGNTVTLTTVPDAGYESASVSVKDSNDNDVTVSGTGNTRTFTMPASAVTVTATFTPIDYAVTVGTVTGGAVSANTATAHIGDEITLTPTPGSGYQAPVTYTVKYTGEETAVTVTDNMFTMPAHAVTVTAAFTPTDYTVTVTQPEVGGTIGADKTTANIDDEITLTVTPSTGYQLDALTVKDANDQNVTVTDNKFTMPASAVTVTATFTAIDYTVSIAETTNGTVTADKTSGVHYGDEITLNATADSGYALASLTVKDASNQDVAVTDGKFTMPASDVTVTATFDELATYTIFYRASGTPGSVKFRTTGSGDGNNMTNSAKLGNIDCWAVQISAVKDKTAIPVAFSTDGGSTWGDLNNRDVVSDIPSDLAEDSAVIVKGEAEAFIVSFLWGDITEDGETGSYQAVTGGSKNFLVTNNTTSVSVPDPAKTGYTFLGWDDGKSSSFKQSSNGTVNISGISENTIFSARWRINTSTVTYNLNGGSGSAPNATVNYGDKITAPANPTRDGYAFVRWVVANPTTQQIGGQARRLSAGTAFDFNDTQIINNLTLKAEWKHVHSYVCLPLDHAAFGGAFADFYGYKGQLHIKVCTSMDAYSVEAHSFVNGKCVCGASIFDNKVSLTKIIDADSSTMQAIKNSVVSISAPSNKNSKQFTKWQYSTDGSNWSDLTASPYVAFAIPSNLQVKAVYEGPSVKQTITSFLYNGNLAFQFNYSVPEGMTVVDAGLLTGNNSHIKYMAAKQLTGASGLADIMFPYIPTTEMPIHYDPANDDAVAKFGAQKVAQKMFREEAINVSGNSNPIFKRCAVLGRTGTAALAINTSGNNIYYYGMGYVICKNSSGNLVVFMTNAISATKGNPNHTASSTNPVQ